VDEERERTLAGSINMAALNPEESLRRRRRQKM
jgi:hypothetical protein